MDKPGNKTNDNRLLLKYAGITMQMIVGLGVGVYAGLKLDDWLHFSMPLLVWMIPLAIIVAMIWQLIKDTSKK
jgi:type IV secretory pathway TrbD component